MILFGCSLADSAHKESSPYGDAMISWQRAMIEWEPCGRGGTSGPWQVGFSPCSMECLRLGESRVIRWPSRDVGCFQIGMFEQIFKLCIFPPAQDFVESPFPFLIWVPVGTRVPFASLCLKVKVTQLCLCIVHGILQARILEWVAFPFSRGSSQPRNRTQVSHIAGGFFTSWATREAQEYWSG